ncbi:hypothetical protein BDZ88DRAFT_57449 [Geranomyces variabilis]|nr:hypothetical protein BDZ88DRAFT_57449 [Geranomyces variabilis]
MTMDCSLSPHLPHRSYQQCHSEPASSNSKYRPAILSITSSLSLWLPAGLYPDSITPARSCSSNLTARNFHPGNLSSISGDTDVAPTITTVPPLRNPRRVPSSTATTSSHPASTSQTNASTPPGKSEAIAATSPALSVIARAFSVCESGRAAGVAKTLVTCEVSCVVSVTAQSRLAPLARREAASGRTAGLPDDSSRMSLFSRGAGGGTWVWGGGGGSIGRERNLL